MSFASFPRPEFIKNSAIFSASFLLGLFKDKSKFESIARQALELIDTQLKGSEYPKSDFMRNVLLTSVFDRALMDPLTPVVHRTWADN